MLGFNFFDYSFDSGGLLQLQESNAESGKFAIFKFVCVQEGRARLDICIRPSEVWLAGISLMRSARRDARHAEKLKRRAAERAAQEHRERSANALQDAAAQRAGQTAHFVQQLADIAERRERLWAARLEDGEPLPTVSLSTIKSDAYLERLYCDL